MDEGTDRPAQIRVFPDYAHTVIWYRGPVQYETTELSPDLVKRLCAWEQFYYDSYDDSPTDDFEWRPPSAASTFTADGTALARRVALEVGLEFEVEFASYEDGAPVVTFQASGPAENPKAAAAFAELVAEAEREDAQTEEMIADGGEWSAYAPNSGTTFHPDRQAQADSQPPTS